jgi:prepilin-type N-terminal cleavage/methylation domain-containing protein
MQRSEGIECRRAGNDTHRFGGPPRIDRRVGFTLAEMLVATVVLAVLVLFVTRLVNHAAVVVTQGNKHMETESHVRPLFDRLALDIAQMVKRTDVSYYLKNQFNTAGSIMGSGSAGLNDWLAFYSGVPGFYNDNGLGYNSRYSVIAYRVNADPASASYNKVERMAKGLALNGAYSTDQDTVPGLPLLFVDNANPTFYTTTIEAQWPAATAKSTPSPVPNYYPPATDPYQKYELIGPHIFRLEYYYLTSVAPAKLVAYPTTGQFKDPTLDWHDPNYVNIKDVAAIVVAVGVIDAQSRKLLTDTDMQKLVTKLTNYTFVGTTASPPPGWLLQEWRNNLQTDGEIAAMPLPARQGIRFYERYFYLNQ